MVNISKIIKNLVGAFEKIEKYKKFPIFLYMTWAKTLHFKSFVTDSML